MLKRSKVIYSEKWPKLASLETKILIYDELLESFPEVKTWIETFPHRLAVRAGEDLKTLESMIEIINILQDLTEGESGRPTLVGLGGGSVSDFVGFVASTWKRGVPLIHIPSTWLSAIDSAHGGKTALNLNSVKNQIGTFYLADQIYLIKPLLFTQAPERALDAKGEVIKTALLSGGALWKKVKGIEVFSNEHIWKLLKPLVEFKYKIVSLDPFEKKGIRYFLNLGHTFGHAYESFFQRGHGASVYQGLRWAIEYSVKNKVMNKKMRDQIFSENCFFEPLDLRILEESFQKELPRLFKQDKKSLGNDKVNFVFLSQPGKPKVKSIGLKNVLSV